MLYFVRLLTHSFQLEEFGQQDLLILNYDEQLGI